MHVYVCHVCMSAYIINKAMQPTRHTGKCCNVNCTPEFEERGGLSLEPSKASPVEADYEIRSGGSGPSTSLCAVRESAWRALTSGFPDKQNSQSIGIFPEGACMLGSAGKELSPCRTGQHPVFRGFDIAFNTWFAALLWLWLVPGALGVERTEGTEHGETGVELFQILCRCCELLTC